MTDLYTCTGKQVLRDGQHFADARDPDAAQFITDALNYDAPVHEQADYDRVTSERTTLGFTHNVRQESDEYACSCGKRWDVSEGEDHP